MKKLYTFKNGPVFLAHPVEWKLQSSASSINYNTNQKGSPNWK